MLLRMIWISALAIAAVALGIMLLLIAARLFEAIRARRREAHRQALLMSLLSWLEAGTDDAAMKKALTANRAVATSLLIEIFELVRGEDQERLARLTEQTSLPQYLRQIIEIGSSRERIAAAESLVWFPSDKTRAVLRFALFDRNIDVGLAAATSLAEMGEELPIRHLLETRLGEDGESSKQLEAVLVRVAPRQAGELLALAQDNEAPERLRAAAIDALSRTGTFELIGPIAALGQSPSAAIRAAVARGIGVLGHPGGADTVTRLLTDPHWEVRAEAAEAVGRIGLIEAMDTLSRLLDDENWWVRFRAGAALAALGSAGISMLKRIAATYADGTGRMAATVLAERGLS